MKNLTTINDLISYQAVKFSNLRALNFKVGGELKSFSNQDFFDNVFYFAAGLREIGFKKGQVFANYSHQNPIWLIVDLGAILAGAITVPIFENISNDNLAYEINDAAVEFIFTDNDRFLIADRQLTVISYGFESNNSITFENLIALGKKAVADRKYEFEKLKSESDAHEIATIIYTSGTGGRPKGVEITHDNIISQIKATQQFFPLKEGEIVLSFLPMAHIFERMVMMYYLTQGVSVYFADDVKNVGNILREISPQLMTTVPRMLEKVYAAINEKMDAANFFSRILGKMALKRALNKSVDSPKNFCDKIFDALVYKKFRAALGGKMEMIICGGAALSLDLQRFYKNIGINIFCGYGLTETSPVIAANSPKNYKIGTVGKVFPQVEIKIDKDGELMVAGPNVMRGYHNLPQMNAEVFDGKWLRTGDRASIDDKGFLTITGRKKELFKNANGKYVSPIVIEQKLLQQLGFLLGAIVIAEGRKFTSALLFPDFEILGKFKSKMDFAGTDEEFLKSKKLHDFVEARIKEINKNLDHWEQVQKFYIATKPISVESGEITPSMKLKRNLLEEKYKKEIDALYSN